MLDRTQIDLLASGEEIRCLNLSDRALSHDAIVLLGFQRTKQISRKSRLAWKEGNPVPLQREALLRRRDIFEGALLEIYQEYMPLRQFLTDNDLRPSNIIDIGCGQALNDLFLHKDFEPHFTLVDIEETDDQYHAWSNQGSGYASLDDARALLHDNGVAASKVVTINPRQAPDALIGLEGDLVTSFYSCGFHYPVDTYLPLFLKVLRGGGIVCLDLRNNYVLNHPDSANQLLQAGQAYELYQDDKSRRILLRA